jgi:cytochrome c-type biogenesis protein CcmH
MNLWIVIAAMTVVAAAILLLPLVRRRTGAPRSDHDLAVYRDQLAELARDEARGLLAGGEAAAARLEIERRILATGSSEPPARPGSKRARITLMLVAVLGPLAAIALYLDQGAPRMPGHPFAERAKTPSKPEANDAKIAAMVAKLAERLKNAPGDLDGWTLLGRSYMALARYDEAAAAFTHAASLNPTDASLQAGQGEALVFAAKGIVTPAARDVFEAALAIDPKEPRSRFFLGLASIQAGEPKAALAAWEALAAEGPADAPWLPELNRQIAKLKESLAGESKETPEKSPPNKPSDSAPRPEAP